MHAKTVKKNNVHLHVVVGYAINKAREARRARGEIVTLGK